MFFVISGARNCYFQTVYNIAPDYRLNELGCWDTIYNSGVVTQIEKGRNKELKPWLTCREDLTKELKKLGLTEADLNLDKMPTILDTQNDQVDKERANL